VVTVEIKVPFPLTGEGGAMCKFVAETKFGFSEIEWASFPEAVCQAARVVWLAVPS